MTTTLKIDGQPVPERVIAAFREAIDHAPDRELLETVRANRKALLDGFRDSPAAAAAVRTRLKGLLASADHLDPSLHAILAAVSLQDRLLTVLSKKAIAAGLDDFCALHGEAALVAGMLLDARSEIREGGWKRAATWKADESPTLHRDAGLKGIAGTFGPFLKEVSAWMPERAAPAPAPAAKRDLDELRQRLQAQESATSRAMKAEREATEKLAKAQRELESLRRNLEARIAQGQEAAKARDGAEARLRELESEMDARVQAGVAREVDGLLRPWLGRAQATDASAPPSGEDIVAQAEAILRDQEAQDRLTGNRNSLRRRLADCERLLQSVREARATALRPLPGLATAEAGLAEESARLSRLLELPTVPLAPGAALLSRINDAASHDDIAAIRRFVKEGSDLGAITAEQARALFARAFDRESALYDSERLDGHRPSPAKANPLVRLRGARDDDESLLVAIDGHNALFALTDLLGNAFEGGVPGKEARAQLMAMMKALAPRLPRVSIRLYFDGEYAHEEGLTESVRVVYTGGVGEQRADDRIAADLAYYEPKGQYDAIFVVTNDRELARRVEAGGGVVVLVEEFRVLLRAAG